MIFISHRGNISFIDEKKENSPDYIIGALNLGFYVEIDLHVIGKNLFLGHDKPTYKINKDFLNNNKLFVHCKNKEALLFMSKEKLACEYFWHQEDKYTLTSKGNIWVYTGEELLHNSICVMPENHNYEDISICYGICSDKIESYREQLKKPS
jgi:hypothetical protein